MHDFVLNGSVKLLHPKLNLGLTPTILLSEVPILSLLISEAGFDRSPKNLVSAPISNRDDEILLAKAVERSRILPENCIECTATLN